ncbi:Ubiquitin-associated protein 2-like [Acropora cervicornis]|uniref:Ubiquitin-associated protein 2-like n=1 Tax=Acropora cervicornis TaxID=6130 RepID=A0AAD9PRL7_ACRCE|nr:Ubiquitin-associated protein 2-like [Acropora cervicornis]
MKGGGTVSHTKHPDAIPAKKPTAEQMRYAQLLSNEDSSEMKSKIKQVADVTGFNLDEVSIALYDCNFDTEAAINALLEGQQDQGEWVMRTGRKKKHQTPVTHGIDSIITSAQTAPSHATITSQRRNRQFGDQNNTADKDKRNDGMMNHSDKNAGENGRGRGGPPRRGGRGGGGTGRPGRSFQSRSRDRPNRFGGGNKNAPFAENINGPTVNGKETWGDEDDDITDTQTKAGSSEVVPPTTEEWGADEWNPVEQPVTSNITDDLFSHVGPETQSWGDSVENTVSWDIDAQTVISATPTVATC